MMEEQDALTSPPAAQDATQGAAQDAAQGATQGGTAAPPEATPPRRALAGLRQPALWLALLALALLAWQMIALRDRNAELQQDVAQRLAAGDATVSEARAAARQSEAALTALQDRLGAVEARLAESQSQQGALDAMVQELTRNHDERLLAEVGQALNTAAQQLQFAGNVEAALIALQGAEARLAAAGQTQLFPLRKAVVLDIERLKALPLADVPGIALRIDSVTRAVDTMPLAFEARPQAAPQDAAAAAAAAPATAPAASATTATASADSGTADWRALLNEVWREMKGLVRIERLDQPAPALLSPSHAFFLRENLKLRLVNARLALLQRDGATFQQDIAQAQDWIERYYDTRAKPAQAALATLRQLAAADVGAALPNLQESLTALRNLEAARAKDAPSSPKPVRAANGAGSAGTN
ncbi:MAG: uroporphyrinogen-III C-methyltransferase [Zoogloeaceae bacterium]|jgi:uroporphyrin-3 C-methyltransferase|nr:uroporphyrinogen-III C-methyltransferase [Zoogloeaceae bacterium]